MGLGLPGSPGDQASSSSEETRWRQVRQPQVTFDYIKRFFPSTFMLMWLPLERAPMQYSLPEESELLLHEAYKTAQMSACGFGVNLALTDVELQSNTWLEFVSDKEQAGRVLRGRYDPASAKNVEFMLDVRANWLKYKDDPEMALKMFRAAIELVHSDQSQVRRALHHRGRPRDCELDDDDRARTMVQPARERRVRASVQSR